MIKVLAIDDEPLALRLLEVYIGKTPGIELLASCRSAAEAEPWLGQADAMLIDINMPDMSGMEFVRLLKEPPLVIFTTAYSEYAVEGFRVNAVDYLLKPFSLAEFQQAVSKLQERLSARRAGRSQDDGILQIDTPHRSLRLDTRRIRFIEGMGEYLKIHLEGENAPLVILYRMKKMAEELPQDRFLRIHKSYIVPLDRVQEARRNTVTISDGTSLPLGESYRDDFRKRFSR